MKDLATIHLQLGLGEYDLSRHALYRMVERNVSRAEIEEAGPNAEIIEEYPDDKYSPSVLLLGFTFSERPLHIQVSLGDTVRTKIITVYEPDPRIWIGFRIRR